MEFTVAERKAGKKSEAKKLRREGNIPAIIYSKGDKGKEIVIEGSEFKKALNSKEPGSLSSTVFSLKLNGKPTQAILKDIQYNITTYDVIHLDFEELHDSIPVTLNVPIRCTNVANCAGIKLGGFLRQVIRTLKVVCLPKDIPSAFEIDIQNMALGETLKLKDIEMPKNVRPIGDLNQVGIVIARK